jgi:hypothetical protein
MKRTYLTIISLALATAIQATEPAGKGDGDAPSAAEIKAIAEEGFIYGLRS